MNCQCHLISLRGVWKGYNCYWMLCVECSDQIFTQNQIKLEKRYCCPLLLFLLPVWILCAITEWSGSNEKWCDQKFFWQNSMHYGSFDQWIVETFTMSAWFKCSCAPNFSVKLVHALSACQQLMLKLSFAISARLSGQKWGPVFARVGFNWNWFCLQRRKLL